jgi:hypothetical protein
MTHLIKAKGFEGPPPDFFMTKTAEELVVGRTLTTLGIFLVSASLSIRVCDKVVINLWGDHYTALACRVVEDQTVLGWLEYQFAMQAISEDFRDRLGLYERLGRGLGRSTCTLLLLRGDRQRFIAFESFCRRDLLASVRAFLCMLTISFRLELFSKRLKKLSPLDSYQVNEFIISNFSPL